MKNNWLWFSLVSLILSFGCERQAEVVANPGGIKSISTLPSEESQPNAVAAVDTQRILRSDDEPQNWMSHGRSYSEQRYSPLGAITHKNIADMGMAWHFDLYTKRGVEATPIVVDGVMYTIGSWSIVYALDAKTGELLWDYDPLVPRESASKGCCDVVNRGVAVWEGKVIFGSFDGRLIALNAATGELEWEVLTVDQSLNHTITGAPRIINDKVIIGFGGADMGIVRGYVSAYDVDSGDLVWRFYTVPGNPDDGFEDETMEMAAQTWTGEWWKLGGGGTVWDSMAYDPELNYLYIGVGNGAPWNQRLRSPEGGDNLFLSSIVALDVDSGEYKWHYQTTPGESWDYTATQHIVLAELQINGENRKVLMQAPKNGFFYVVDRISGELISAEPYAPINWATHVDLETGRPVETEIARYSDSEPSLIEPGPGGAHNWHPMSYSPDTGLVYIPTTPSSLMYQGVKEGKVTPGAVSMGIHYDAFAPPPDIPDAELPGFPSGVLSAWDPVRQEERWRVTHAGTWNGGTLTTAGNLVFQGTSNGNFVAFDATSGDILWTSPTQTAVMAAPITYEIDGEQYVAVMAGWGGILALHAAPFVKSLAVENRSRVLVYKLGASNELPPPYPVSSRSLNPPAAFGTQEQIDRGRIVFHRQCQFCHGGGAVGGAIVPDLRYSDESVHNLWSEIVLGGLLKGNGMPSFDGLLNEEDAQAVRAYVLQRAHREKNNRSEHEVK